MNYPIVRNILGKIMILTAALMGLPLLVSIIYQEDLINIISFLVPIALLLGVGYLFTFKKAKNRKMLAREGFVIVGLTWIIIALFGCLPFIISGTIPNFFDAFFEMVSGFTTTGASILEDVTALDHSMIFWRSFSHWIGGMGVLVFILAIIPESKEGSALHILKAESPGPQVGRLVSKMQVTSRILYLIYLGLTVIMILLLWLGPDKEMKLFQSIIYSLGTAGTGGFSMHTYSIEFFTPYSQYIISIFMIIFGINFSLFYLILIGNVKDVLKNEELRVFFIIIAVSVLAISINTYSIYQNVEETFRKALFQVASIISTTGYSTANFDKWPVLSKTILVILMIFGGCAGSTAGGMKISRLDILAKASVQNVKKMVNPRKVETLCIDDKPVSDSTVVGVLGYVVVYCIILMTSVLLISIDNYDFETNFTASLSCLSNVGPGLGAVGPYGSFNGYSDFSTLVLSIVMITGRLELFPMLILFSPNTWKKNL